MKKTLALILCLVMVFGLVACGATESTATTATTETTTTTEATADATEAKTDFS